MDIGKDDFEKYLSLWDQACAKEEEKAPKLDVNPELYNEFIPKAENKGNLDDAIARYISGEVSKSYQPKEELLSEEDLTKPELAHAADVMGKNPNPLRPGTLGKDQNLNVTQNWSSGKELEELARMKLDLHNLEDKLNTSDMQQTDANSDKIMNKIKQLKRDIDEISDLLPPDLFYNSNKEED